MRNLSVENTLFLYKNNFIRTKPLVLEKKTDKQTKNKARFVVPQNIGIKCLGWLFLK